MKEVENAEDAENEDACRRGKWNERKNGRKEEEGRKEKGNKQTMKDQKP